MESEALIQPDRRVFGKDVQKRNCAAFEDTAREMPCDGGTETAPARRRMNAYRTELDEAGEAETLATHRQQAAMLAVTRVVAEHGRTRRKRARCGKGRQIQHVGDIVRTKRCRFDVAPFRREG